MLSCCLDQLWQNLVVVCDERKAEGGVPKPSDIRVHHRVIKQRVMRRVHRLGYSLVILPAFNKESHLEQNFHVLIELARL